MIPLILAASLLICHAGTDTPDPEPDPEDSALENTIPPFDFGGIPQALRAAVYSSRLLPIGERIAAISEPLLGLPYEDGPAGEGWGQDPDPPARYDVFDCVTFIEEVLALALAADPAAVPYYRRALRFKDGQSSYEARNHFFAAEWIPNNISAGLLKDITQELGHAEILDKTVTSATWSHWKRRYLFKLPDKRLPTGSYYLPVLPLDEAIRVAPRIPPGALVVTVRIPIDHIPILVTHVGIAVPADVPMMRHATRMSNRTIKDNTIAWYLEHLKGYSRWPVAGINVLMPLEQGPRAAPEQGIPPEEILIDLEAEALAGS